jgi:hypothetical protein
MDGSRWRERKKKYLRDFVEMPFENKDNKQKKVKITEQQIGSKNDSFVEKNASRFIHSKNA